MGSMITRGRVEGTASSAIRGAPVRTVEGSSKAKYSRLDASSGKGRLSSMARGVSRGCTCSSKKWLSHSFCSLFNSSIRRK